MRLRIMSSPACSDRWKCGISRGSPAISSNSASSISMLSSEDRRSRVEARLGGEQALAQRAEAAVVIGDVDAGQHDLLRAAVDLARDRVADRLERQRAARPARLPDRAEGAAMVAAGLDRDEAACTLRMKPAATGVMTSFAAKALSLLAFPTTRDTPGIAAKVVGSSSAAQPVTRIRASGRCALGAADRLARLADRFVGHRAAVDDDPVLVRRAPSARSSRSRRN